MGLPAKEHKGRRGLTGSAHVHDLAGFDGLQSNETSRDVRLDIGDAVRVSANQKDGDIGFCKILLMRQPFVEGDQDLKLALREAEKFSIGPTRKTRFMDCGTRVLGGGEAALEASGNALIEQKVHSN